MTQMMLRGDDSPASEVHHDREDTSFPLALRGDLDDADGPPTDVLTLPVNLFAAVPPVAGFEPRGRCWEAHTALLPALADPLFPPAPRAPEPVEARVRSSPWFTPGMDLRPIAQHTVAVPPQVLEVGAGLPALPIRRPGAAIQRGDAGYGRPTNGAHQTILGQIDWPGPEHVAAHEARYGGGDEEGRAMMERILTGLRNL
jgi:hypothetical protein